MTPPACDRQVSVQHAGGCGVASHRRRCLVGETLRSQGSGMRTRVSQQLLARSAGSMGNIHPWLDVCGSLTRVIAAPPPPPPPPPHPVKAYFHRAEAARGVPGCSRLVTFEPVAFPRNAVARGQLAGWMPEPGPHPPTHPASQPARQQCFRSTRRPDWLQRRRWDGTAPVHSSQPHPEEGGVHHPPGSPGNDPKCGNLKCK